MTDVFNMFDRDGSGEIELQEITTAFNRQGKATEKTRAKVKAHFDFMDSDGSGKTISPRTLWSELDERDPFVSNTL